MWSSDSLGRVGPLPFLLRQAVVGTHTVSIKISVRGAPRVQTPSTLLEESALRRPRVRVLFAHRDPSRIDLCVQELRRIGFAVDLHIVSGIEEITQHPHLQSFDVLVCEYASLDSQRDGITKFLAVISKSLPLILLVDNISREAAASLLLHGVAECVDTSAISHLPVA